jgi:hypothetical protein
MKYLKTHRKHHPNISQLAQLLPTPQRFQMDWAENRVPHSILWFIIIFLIKNTWLVVSTPLKNISQLGLIFPIYGKIKNVPNHQPVIIWMFQNLKKSSRR